LREICKHLQFMVAGLGAWLGWFLGSYDGFIYALVALVTIDYITGVMRAFVEKQLSSEIGVRGIVKKVLIFTLVGIGHTIDSQVLGGGNTIRTAVIFFYLSNEGVSILENAAHIGLPIPEKLKNALEQLHGRSNEEDEKK
jgi:toxin secretion/phage lysis holin